MKNILVTGANGLLGTNVIHALVAAGYNAIGLLRRKDSFRGVLSGSLELVEGDITSKSDVMSAAAGCDAIIHCAACTSQKAGMKVYYDVNTGGALNILEAAKALGIRRIVNISTANIFAYGSMEHPGDESGKSVPPFSESGYVLSKLAAQECMKEYNQYVETITLCPTFMLGPYGSKPSSGRIILMGYRRKLIFYPPGGKNFVAVQDVARCAVAALSKGTPGKEYLLCGENMSYKDFFRLLASRTDSRGMMIKVPGALLKMAGRLGSALEKGLHIRNEFNSRNMEMLRIGNYYRSDRAAKELGFSCRPVSEAVDEAIGWFRKEKIIR